MGSILCKVVRRCARLLLPIALSALLLIGCGRGVPTSFDSMRDPVIAVLCQMSREVVLLDPGDLRVVRRVPLKSQSLDFDVVGRDVLTAQSGGHGSEMGREFGRLDLGAGRVAYTTLSSMDVQTVNATEAGWFMLTTGLISPKGHWLHRVSAQGSVEDLQLSPGLGGSASTHDRVWVWRYWDDETGHPIETYHIYGERGPALAIASEMTRTVGLCGFDDEIIAFGIDDKRAMLVRHDGHSGDVLAKSLIDAFRVGPSYAWAAGPYVAVADGPAEDYYQATRLVIVDARSLGVVGTVEALSGVSAVAIGPDGRVLVCEGDGTVSLVDSSTWAKSCSASVGDPKGDLVDIEYIP